MANPAGATNYITITSTAAQVAASMPDVGSTFAADLVIDQAAGTNYEGGAETFIDGLAADYSDLRVTDATGDITVAFGVKQFSQTAGSRKLILGLGIPSTAPLLSSAAVEYRLWRGCTGGTAQNKAGVAPTAAGYVGYWPLEESSGTFYDWTANANNGADYAGDTDKTGKVASGQRFDGVDDYISMAHSTSFNMATAVTIQSWINPTELAATEQYYNAKNANHLRSGIQKVSGVYYPRFRVACASYLYDKTASAGFALGDWHHVAWRYDGTDLRCYLDGACVTTFRNGGGDVDDSTAAMILGARQAGADSVRYGGSIDELQWHNVARSANWIATYYRMTSANGTFWTVGAEQSLATPIAFPFRAANVSRWRLSGANGDRGSGLNAADIHRWRLS